MRERATARNLQAHTGKQSLKITSQAIFDQNTLKVQDDKNYVFSGWLSRDNTNTYTYANLGFFWLDQNDHEKALSDFLESSRFDFNNASAYYGIGQIKVSHSILLQEIAVLEVWFSLFDELPIKSSFLV